MVLMERLHMPQPFGQMLLGHACHYLRKCCWYRVAVWQCQLSRRYMLVAKASKVQPSELAHMDGPKTCLDLGYMEHSQRSTEREGS